MRRPVPLHWNDNFAVELVNEFASVALEFDHVGLGPRLIIYSRRAGLSRAFDPMSLAVMAEVEERKLRDLGDPSNRVGSDEFALALRDEQVVSFTSSTKERPPPGFGIRDHVDGGDR